MIDGIHGDTNSGKTKAIEMLAGHLWEHSGLKTRVWCGDGGSETYNDRGLVDDGVIEIMDPTTREYPMTVLKLISDFWFLKELKNPNAKLVAPTPNWHEKYGLAVFEGGSVFGGWLLSDIPGGLSWHAAEETGFGGIKDEDGVLSYQDDFKGAEGEFKGYIDQGANSPKHYMLAQRKILSAIRATKKFPGITLWTFHSTEGADRGQGGESGKFGQITGKKVIGPDMAGRAWVSTLNREFGNLLHFDQVNLSRKEKDATSGKQITTVEREFRLYTRRHFDPNQDVLIEYIAGTRMSGVADYYTSKVPGDSLLQFYQAVKEQREKAKLAHGTSVASPEGVK